MINEKVFCAFPWVGIHIKPDGGFYSCCVAEANKFIVDSNTKTVDQLYNSEELKQLRLDLIAGTPRPDVCKNCYKKDEAGFPSPRTVSLKDFSYKGEHDDITDAFRDFARRYGIRVYAPQGYKFNLKRK